MPQEVQTSCYENPETHFSGLKQSLFRIVNPLKRVYRSFVA